MAKRSPQTPKYKQVYAALWREIQSGRLHDGDRLPSEAELERRFAASRITVGRAMRDLQSAGLVERRAGSGTYVRTPRVEGALSFGLLIPDLGETEIFEPICQGMMASPLAREHALVWGSLNRADGSKEERAWQLSRQYIERRVAGVFFAPLELTSTKDDVNRRIAEAIDLSKRMNRIIKQNVVFSITVIMILIASNFFQMLDLPYGVIGHEGSTILVILNSLRLLK